MRDCAEAGVWAAVHELLLVELRAAGAPRRAVDGSHVRSQRGHVGPSPFDRGRPGFKHHLFVEANGSPLQVTFTGGNRNDVT